VEIFLQNPFEVLEGDNFWGMGPNGEILQKLNQSINQSIKWKRGSNE
jgi:hypothetical protein